MQILFARQQQASAWFNPELLAVPLATIQAWMAADPELAVYRFFVESLFHEQEHVLDEAGERLLSYAGRFNGVPADTYSALTTADKKFPSIRLESGEQVTLTYAQYRALLETSRIQADRAAAYRAFHQSFADSQNTIAAMYNGVLQRDWFQARARGYASTLDAALHGNDIPPSVVENLIAAAKAGVEPLRRYHRLRRRVLGLERYCLYDVFVPLVRRRTSAIPTTTWGSGSWSRWRRSAATTRSRCGGRSASAGSTCSRTRASAAAPTRRPCTAPIRTCC